MATGDQADFTQRLYGSLPAGWFPDLADAPILGAVLAGNAATWATTYSLLKYTAAQTRLATSTDIFLDMFAADYFGTGLPRLSGETDTAYRARIESNMYRTAVTREAVISAASIACGSQATIFEPTQPADTGVYDNGTMAYDVAGGYGSNLIPRQFFVKAIITNGATRAQVCAAIDAVKPSGRTVWVRTS